MTALTNDEKILLLTQAGVSVEDAQEQVLGAAPTVIEEHPANCACALCHSEGTNAFAALGQAVEQFRSEIVSTPVDTPVEVVGFDFDATLKRIIGKAYANKDKAMSLCDEQGKTYFDTLKVRKVQAAARGLDKTAHNKRVWDDSQKIVTTLKRMVRDHYRVTSVKAKIAASKAALPQEVRDLDDERLERLLASEEFLALLRKEGNG